jgi:pimeloyl-ACP methyl ester carboxylesterase
MLLARDVAIDGRRLEIVEHEPPVVAPQRLARAATTILMLHEGLGSVALWKSFPADLAARTNRRVITYSRYGHGKSDVLEAARDVDYMHHEAQVVLPYLIRELDLDRPILFGHSDGASIALIGAGARPELVSALVLEAPHVFVEAETIASIEAARSAFLQTDLPRRLARYHRDVERTFWGWNDIWLDPRFRQWNIESSLGGVRCPLLLIQGEDDEYGTVAQLDAIAAAVPDTQVMLLADCGHSPHRDQADATLVAVERFLSRPDVAHIAPPGRQATAT